MNTSYNALDVHVAMGNGDKVALRYDSPLSGTKRSLTYKELLEQGALLCMPLWVLLLAALTTHSVQQWRRSPGDSRSSA